MADFIVGGAPLSPRERIKLNNKAQDALGRGDWPLAVRIYTTTGNGEAIKKVSQTLLIQGKITESLEVMQRCSPSGFSELCAKVAAAISTVMTA